MSNNAQKFVARRRRPRSSWVQLRLPCEYSLFEGELPFVIGVLADLAGNPATPRPPVHERQFLAFDTDNFDARMRQHRPRVRFRVPDTLTGGGELPVDLSFECLTDFQPDAVARQIGPLRSLLEERTSLIRQLIAASAGGGIEQDRRNLEQTIAELGGRISEQVALVLHHPDLQRLEATWRGLHFLISRTESGADLQIRALDVTKEELARALQDMDGDYFEENPIYQKIVTAELFRFGGQPFGCLISDYAFDHRRGDVILLRDLARTAATAHAPFIASAAPSLLGLTSWRQLKELRDPAAVQNAKTYLIAQLTHPQ